MQGINRYYLILTSMLMCLSFAAQAEGFRCNRSQSFCVIQSTRLTIGDRVGIFNDDNELIASGEVSRINGQTRRFEIKRRYGRILRRHQVAVLDLAADDTFKRDFRLYRKPSQVDIGGSLTLGKLGVGDGAPSYFGQGYYERDWKYGVHWVARGFFINASGDVNGKEAGLLDTGFAMYGIGALPGLAYELRENKNLSFRGEVGLGLAYVSAEVGDGSLGQYVHELESGFGLTEAMEGSILYRYQEWRPGVTVGLLRLQKAIMPHVGLTLVRELR